MYVLKMERVWSAMHKEAEKRSMEIFWQLFKEGKSFDEIEEKSDQRIIFTKILGTEMEKYKHLLED